MFNTVIPELFRIVIFLLKKKIKAVNTGMYMYIGECMYLQIILLSQHLSVFPSIEYANGLNLGKCKGD